jgi:hypothetical protein
MPLPCDSHPFFAKNEELELLLLFDEAKGDLRYRFLDLEEALEVLQDAIEILKQERNVAEFETCYHTFRQQIETYQREVFDEIEHMMNEAIDEWLSQEFPAILNNFHQQICHLTWFAYEVHQCWVTLLKQCSDEPLTASEEF